MQVSTVTATPDGVLHVTGLDAAGETITATGWVSATTQHFAPADYYPAGTMLAANAARPDVVQDVGDHLVPGATPQPMTQVEIGEYALRLLREVHGAPAVPVPVPFVEPAAPA